METLAHTYQFTHKSGRKIIAQTNSEFYHMQGHKSDKVPAYLKTGKDGQFERECWASQQVRLGYKEWSGYANKSQYDSEAKLNKFWEGAKGFEKLKRGCHEMNGIYYSNLKTGYFGCPLKRFLAEIQNQAIMEGDQAKYDKAESLYPRGNMLALPVGK